jgi:hypothetical protein
MAQIDLLSALERMGYYEASEQEKEAIMRVVIDEDLDILARALEEYARSGAQKEKSFLDWMSEGGNGRI